MIVARLTPNAGYSCAMTANSADHAVARGCPSARLLMGCRLREYVVVPSRLIMDMVEWIAMASAGHIGKGEMVKSAPATACI